MSHALAPPAAPRHMPSTDAVQSAPSPPTANANQAAQRLGDGHLQPRQGARMITLPRVVSLRSGAPGDFRSRCIADAHALGSGGRSTAQEGRLSA